MGKTQVPLVIWVDDDWRDLPEVLELVEKGHKVWTLSMAVDTHALLPDLILSRAAWNWDGDMWPNLETALKAMRARKKGKKGE